MSNKLTNEKLQVLLNSKVDPTTGLQQPERSSNLTNEDLARGLKYASPSSFLGGKDLQQDPTKFNFALRTDADNQELRAQNQSFTQRTMHGAGRLIGTTVTKALSGLGYVGSGIGALAKGDINVMLDNGWSAAFNELEEDIKEALPIHHTRKYLEGNVWEQMGTWGFWMDDVVDGAAFMLSSAIGAKGLDKLGTATKVYGNLAKAVSKGLRATKLGKDIGKTSIRLKKIADAMDFATVTAYNTTTEAAFEAKDTKDQVLRSLQSKVDRGEISKEEADKIATGAARNTFWWNAAAIGPSNALALGQIFKKYDFLKLGAKGTGPLSKTQVASIFGKNALLSAASEGLYEENIQNAIQSYNTDVNTGFGQNGDWKDHLTGVLSNAAKNFTTDEGQKAMALGAIIGLIPGGVGGVRNAQESNKRNSILATSRGVQLNLLKQGIADLYERDNAGNVVLDENNKAKLNLDKVQSDFAKLYQEQADLTAMLKASNSGNELMVDFLKERQVQSVAKLQAASNLNINSFEDFIDTYAQKEIEEVGEESRDGIEGQAKGYKERAKEYFKIYDSITNNYGGLFNFGNSKEAVAFKESVIDSQFNEAATQYFWETKKKELEESLKVAEDSANVLDLDNKLNALKREKGVEVTEEEAKLRIAPEAAKRIESTKKRIKEIDNILLESYENMKDLLNEGKQKERFEEEKRLIENFKQVVDDAVQQQKTNTRSEADKTSTKDRSGKEVNLSKFSYEDAFRQGYEIDQPATDINNKLNNITPGAITAYSIKNDEANHKQTVFTNGDPSNDVLGVSDVFSRKLQNINTGEEVDANIRFKNNQLVNITYKDTNKGEEVSFTLPTKEDGTKYTLDDFNEVLDLIPAISAFEVKEIEGEYTYLGRKKVSDFDALASQTRLEMKRGNREVQRSISDKVSQIKRDIENGISKGYADSRYGNTTFKELFKDAAIQHYPAIHAGKVGILSLEGGSVIFKETTLVQDDLKLVKNISAVASIEDTTKLSDLEIYIAKDIPFNISIEESGSTYKIQDKLYTNRLVNKIDAVEEDSKGNPISVTLTNELGENIKFTTPNIVDSIASNLLLFEMGKDKTIIDLFGTDYSDFVVIRKENTKYPENYTVYRKGGRYTIYTERGTLVKPHFKNYKTIAFQVDNEISKLAIAYADKLKYNYNKKEVKDELTRLTRIFNSPTTGEALKYPTKSEVLATERVERPKGELKEKEEQDIVNSSIEDDAISESALEQREGQKAVIAEEATTDDLIKLTDSIEPIEPSEVEDRQYENEVLSRGVRHTASAIGYVANIDGQPRPINEEFGKYVINQNIKGDYVTPDLDMENDWWNTDQDYSIEDKQKVKDAIKKGLTAEQIDRLLDSKKPGFTNWVDSLPIKIEYGEFDYGIYMHRSDYPHIRVPKDIEYANYKNNGEYLDAIDKYKNKIKSQTKAARYKIIESLLKGNVVNIPVEGKSMGTPNNIGNKRNLAEVLTKIESNIDLREVTLGVATKDGSIDKGNGRKMVGKGSQGNIFLETSYTANGEVGNFKLNPGYLSQEHAIIVLETLQQAYDRKSGGFKGKYEGKGVTGDLTRSQILKLLVVYGEDNTKVENDPNKQHLKEKQLWVKNARILHYGTKTMPLHNPSKEQLSDFITWATTKKTYAINRDQLNTGVYNKDFTIGNIKFIKGKDNYNSMVLKSGMVLTDLDVVEGTKSLTKDPAVIMDLEAAGISYSEVIPTKKNEVVPKESKVVHTSPKKVANEVKPKVTEASESSSDEVKQKVTKRRKNAAGGVAGDKLGNFTKITSIGVGGSVYLEIENEEGDISKRVLGTVEQDEEGLYFSLKGVGAEFIIVDNAFKSEGGDISLNDAKAFQRINAKVGIFSHMFKYDSPGISESKVEELENKTADIQAETPEVKVVNPPSQEQSNPSPTKAFKNTGKTGLHQLGRSPFKMATKKPGTYTLADLQKETKWIKDRFSDVEVDIIDNFIELAGDRRAMGQSRRDSILLATMAEAGTAYHEAFHRVSLFYLTDEERQGIYNEAKSIYPGLENKKDSEIEEFLAERFRNFIIREQDKRNSKKSWGAKIWDAFKKIWNAISNLWIKPSRFDELTLDRLFSDIEQGRYKRTKIDPTKYKDLTDTSVNSVVKGFELKGTRLYSIQTEQQLKEVVQSMFYTLAETNLLVQYDEETGERTLGLSSVEDLKDIKYGPMFEAIEQEYNDALSIGESNEAFLLEIPTATPSRLREIREQAFGDPNFQGDLQAELRQQADSAFNIGLIYEEILDHSEVFTEVLEDYLNGLNIRTVNKDTDIDLDESPDELDGSTRSDFDKYNKIAFESSAKHNVAANIKLLLSILPASNERSELTGLYTFAEFGQLMSKIYRDLRGIRDAQSMMDKLVELSEGNITYSVLVKHLNKDETLKTQFFRTVNKNALDFVNALVSVEDGKPRITFGASAIQTAGARKLKEWNNSLIRSGLFKHSRGGEPIPNIEAFNKLQNKFIDLYDNIKFQVDRKKSINNLEELKTDLISILNEAGIEIDIKGLELALSDINDIQSEALLDLIQGSETFKSPIYYILGKEGSLDKLFRSKNGTYKNDKGKFINFENVYTDEKGAKYLSNKQAETNPYEEGDSIFGAGGNRYYTIMQHTYTSNTFNEFAKNPEVIEAKLNAVYNKNSRFLNALKDDPKLAEIVGMKTMAAIVREDEYDTGREYQGITELEDYLLRIAANEKGLFTPPTPADRRFYAFYQGFNDLKLDGTMDTEGNINEEVLEVFSDYVKDEEARMRVVRADIDKVIKGQRDSSTLFENYHYKYFGAGETVQEGQVVIEGNDIVPVGKKVKNGGKLLKRNNKYVGGGANYTNFASFNNNTPTNVKQALQSIIRDRLNDEIKYITDLGIVESELDNGNYRITKNLLLDDGMLDRYKKELVTEDEEYAAENIVLDNLINTMMASIETGKLITGDPASYKSPEDHVKRLPGYTSTGDNTRNDFPAEYYTDSPLVHSNKYNVTTFTSKIIESTYYDTLLDIHTNALISEGVVANKNEARSIAKLKLEAYLNVDQTDAQTFITPEMYRAVAIKLGEWNNVKEQAYQQILNGEGSNMTTKDVVFQPLKMTYVNVQYVDGHAIAKFDKMSMATLFRADIKGTKMEKLLDRMEAVGEFKGLEPIHQVKFHTAEKVGGRDRKEIFQDNGEFVELSELNYYDQDFDMLRLQLVTDPHEVNETLVGSQFKKVGMSNVKLTETYGNGKTGAEIVEEINSMLSELSNRGKDSLSEEFNLDKSNKIVDKQVFMDKLKEEGKKAGMPDYILDTFKLNENGDYYVEPDAHPGNRKWIQNRVLSIIKKATIDLKLPGNVFIQMSNIGIAKDKELRLMDEEGYIEAKISVSVFKNMIPSYNTKTHAERVEFLRSRPDITAMAYRIPTQGQNSTFGLKVVDFLDERVGDVIVLPAEGTAVGGFDFNYRVTA